MIHRRPWYGLMSFILTLLLLGAGYMSVAPKTTGPGSGVLTISLDRATYQPGSDVHMELTYQGLPGAEPDTLTVEFIHLTHLVHRVELPIRAEDSPWNITWTPPAHPTGYGVRATLSQNGQVVATTESAFDVAASWLEQPRYGFLSEFGGQDLGSADAQFQSMNRLHLNGLQFYDWLYRHDQPVPPTDVFTDSLGRPLHIGTIEAKIELSRQYGMAPMAYVAIYAASPSFHAEHREWGLYDRSGTPIDFGDGYLYLMDPSRGSGWSAHLIGEFGKVLDRFDFEGVHIDQYGYPKIAYDVNGRTIVVGNAFRTFLDDTKAALVQSAPTRNAVTFNSVANWPAALVAQSAYDFNYIEVWPPYTTYGDLELIIRGAWESSGGKPTVIAAYVEQPHEPTVRLLDAVIFAHGATHIELGEGNGMLVDPYFPKFQAVGSDLWEALVKYYDFIVRYKEWLYGPRAPLAANERVLMGGEAAGPRPVPGQVHAIAYRSTTSARTVLSLINLTATDTVEWKATQPEPSPIQEIEVTLTVDHDPAAVWVASPDADSLAAVQVPFATTRTEDGFAVEFAADLHYWTVVVVE